MGGWAEWQQNRQKRRQQQQGDNGAAGQNGRGGESERHGRWQGRLSTVRASDGLLGKVLTREPNWVVNSGKRGQRLPQTKLRGDDDDYSRHRFRSRRESDSAAVLSADEKQHEQGTGLRVSFPLKFGVGLGTGGGIDSPSLALRIVHIKIGSDLGYRAEDSAQDPDGIRQKRHSESLGSIASKAGDVLNTASVLLLAQAFCGPVASIAMTCMAGAGFTRFATGRLFSLYNKDLEAHHHLRERQWPQPLIDFSTASLLLSIGVPILKRQYPEIHRNLECLGAAAPVALGYIQTTAQVKASPDGAGGLGETLWRHRHRWAARRLCGYLSDFHYPSTFGWLVDIWERTSFLIIPHVLSDRMWVIGSTPLPLGLLSNESSAGKKPHSKTSRRSKQRRLPSAASATAAAETEEVDERSMMVISDEGRGQETNTMYPDFAVMQNGWRKFLERSSLFCRAFYLLLIFSPLIICGPLLYYISTVVAVAWGLKFKGYLWWMLRFCLEKGGAAFIKWGQWSATREDLFPSDLCEYLGRLHDRAPEHSYAETRRAVLKNLGRSIEDIFEDFPRKPFASGSIAQVYRAKLKTVREGMPEEVAVKVRHPSVALRIHQDFQIISALASWAQQLPSLRWLKLRESIDQFSHTLTAQADLRVEAENLSRFRQNFEPLHRVVVFPTLVADLVSEGVIVEGFERGQALHEFLRNRSTLNTQIVAAGVETYLKMLLTDNFLHTDLHPGNILARSADDGQSAVQRAQIVLLDFGLAQELTPAVRYHFLSFMMMIGAGNGERAAHHLLHFSFPQEQTSKSPDLLVEDMKHLFGRECNLRQYSIDLNAVLIKVLQLCRKHEVTIDSAYASLLVASCILVGFARSLDPELSVMDAAVPCLFLYNLTGRIVGQIYG